MNNHHDEDDDKDDEDENERDETVKSVDLKDKTRVISSPTARVFSALI